ncbi:MAG: hypothetical protein IJZ23_08850 [Roseburia sp.]|nr:hypothetical protein [Roseburia sp.]
MLSFFAGIILYNPTQNNIQNIIEYEKGFDKVIVFDNSDNGKNNAEYFEKEKWIYHKAQKNEGISTAINYMLDLCSENHVDFLCTLDQDSIFDLESIHILKEYISNNLRTDIAIYAPRIDYLNRKQRVEKNLISEREWVITSGNFINIKIVREKAIKYDESYFIDRCDRDFCMQITKMNLKIVVNNQAVLCQPLGALEENGRMGHSALRHYYCFRNRFYYNAKYYTGVEKWSRNAVQTIRQIGMILLKESDKYNKIRMLYKAINDYKKGRMGMYGK